MPGAQALFEAHGLGSVEPVGRDAARIEHTDGVAGRMQRKGDGLLIPAGRFESNRHGRHRVAADPAEELRMACSGIGAMLLSAFAVR